MDNNIDLSNKQKQDIKKLFMTFDKDGDGKITNFEVAEALQAHHKDRTKDEIGYMMRILDLDCNKVIEFNEFLEMASLFEAKQNHGVSHLQIRQLFRAFDKELQCAPSLSFFLDLRLNLKPILRPQIWSSLTL